MMVSGTFQHTFPVRACLSREGVHTFTRVRMACLWNSLEEEGKIPFLFYDGETRDQQDYFEFMSSPDVYSYVVYDKTGEIPLATYFVNDFIGRAGKMHFCFLNAGIEHRYAIGIETCNFLLRAGGISALVGITPKPFRHAWQFALNVGFQKMGILPAACRLARLSGGGNRDSHVDAVVTLCTPETLLPMRYEEEHTDGRRRQIQKTQSPRS